MEITKNQIEYKYGAEELHQEIKLFITDVKKMISEKNYSLSEKSQEALNEYEDILWDTYLQNTSKNKRKKLNKYLAAYYFKRNRHKANLLLHFIYTRLLNRNDAFHKVVLQSSLKEQAIQSKRNEWIEARNKALKALQAYKEEKGDFYKWIYNPKKGKIYDPEKGSF